MGCGFAALAMLTGRTYAEVRDYFPEFIHRQGCSTASIDPYLGEAGCAIGRIYGTTAEYTDEGWVSRPKPDWPIAPPAQVNLCHVKVYARSQVHHWVVLLGDGTVLDPETPEPRRLADYHEVLSIGPILRFREE